MDKAIGSWPYGEGEVRVGVHVDESRRNHVSGGIDDGPSLSVVKYSDGDNSIPFNGYVGSWG